jgi:hypothetical protein
MFYDTDNLQCWLLSAIEDQYEAECEDDDPDNMASWKKDVCGSVCTLKTWSEVWLSYALNVSDTDLPIFQAIMNSVDWEDLLSDVRSYFGKDE